MEDIKITIHVPSCEDKKSSGEEFATILKEKLKKYNPTFYFELKPENAKYSFGYSRLSAIDLTKEEQSEIILIIENTFKNL